VTARRRWKETPLPWRLSKPAPAPRLAGGPPATRASRLIALASGAAGAGVVAALLPSLPRLDPAPLLLLAALVVAARLWTLSVYGRGSYAVSTVPVLAAAMLLGPGGAVAVALVSGLAYAAIRRLRWDKALFNCGNFVLAAALAATVFHAAGAELAPGNLPLLLALAAATGLAHYAHTLLAGAAIGAEHRTPPLRAWAEHFAWLGPQYPVLGVLALLLALAYREFGLAGMAAFVVPPAMMLYTAKQYLDRTSRGVQELRALRSELGDEVGRRLGAEAEVARLRGALGRAGSAGV
jgi:hypothetical protein